VIGVISASIPEKKQKTRWTIPIICTKANVGEGINEFAKAVWKSDGIFFGMMRELLRKEKKRSSFS
jgi:putative protein kinase ArgK-like GTPase of G3E family